MSIPHSLRRAMSVLGLVLLSAAAANAQTFNGLLPPRPNEPPATGQYDEPEFVPYVNDLQLFDQPDLSSYGNGTRPPEGWFGSVEYLYWATVNPERSKIGTADSYDVFNPGTTTVDTGTIGLAGGVLTYTDAILVQQFFFGVPLGAATSPRNFTASFIAIGGMPGANPSIPVGLPAVASTTPGFGTIQTGGVEQSSGLDTSFMSTSDFASGGRMEFGRVMQGEGWMVSGFGWGTMTQSLDASNVAVNFENPPFGFVDVRNPNLNTFTSDGYDDDLDGDGVYGRFGRDRGTPVILNGIRVYDASIPDGIPDPEPAGTPATIDYDDAVQLPTRFATVHVETRVGLYSFEAMKLWQVYFGPRGGVWEVFAGPRGMSLNDRFVFFGTTGAVNSANSFFDTTAQNWLMGGQFGGRWSRQRGRWQIGCEARAFLAANYQHVTQQGQIGDPGLVTGAGSAINVQNPRAFSHRSNQTEFSPSAELRLNAKYQMFRSLYLQGGYTALFAQNIARGAEMTRYSLPSMGILSQNNDASFFVHGFNFGLIINR